MTIQIATPGHPPSRLEVTIRIGNLLGSHAAALRADPAPDGYTSDTVSKFREEVASLFFALLGSYPTHDELSRMGAL